MPDDLPEVINKDAVVKKLNQEKFWKRARQLYGDRINAWRQTPAGRRGVPPPIVEVDGEPRRVNRKMRRKNAVVSANSTHGRSIQSAPSCQQTVTNGQRSPVNTEQT